MGQYWIKSGESVKGPFSGSQIKQLARERRLKATHLISTNQIKWVRAGSIKALVFPPESRQDSGALPSIEPSLRAEAEEEVYRNEDGLRASSMDYSMDATQVRRVACVLVGMLVMLGVQVAIFHWLHSLAFLAPVFFKSERIVIVPPQNLCFVCRRTNPDRTTYYGENIGRPMHHHGHCTAPAKIRVGTEQPFIPGVYEYRLTDEKRGMAFMVFFAMIYTPPFVVGYFWSVLRRIDFAIITSGVRPALPQEATRYLEHISDLVHQVTLNSWRLIKKWPPALRSVSHGLPARQSLSLSLGGGVALFTRSISFMCLTVTIFFTNPSVWTRGVALWTFLVLSYIVAVLTHHFA